MKLAVVCKLFVAMLFLVADSIRTTTASSITKSPISITITGGMNSTFSCAGTGAYLTWQIDELLLNDAKIKNRTISAVTNREGGTIESNLTVPGTSENNGTTIRCAIAQSLFHPSVVSNNATLTVLQGVGEVRNLRFEPSFNAVKWDPPFTAGVDLDTLYYWLIVTNLDNNQMIINDTTQTTHYPMMSKEYCAHYNASVNPFSLELSGNPQTTVDKAPGLFYTFKSLSKEVFAYDFHNPGTSSTVNIQATLKLDGIIPCPHQRLTFQTYSHSNTSDVVNHTETVFTGNKTNHLFTAEFEKKDKYTAIFSIVNNKGVIEVKMLNFSTFDIQDCNVTANHESIFVECTYASNSTVLGVVVIQDENGYSMNKSLNRHNGNGFMNITGLHMREYDVAVFDQMEDNYPAYKEKIILSMPEPTATSTAVVRTSIKPTSTVSMPTLSADQMLIIAYTFTGIASVIAVIAVSTCVIIIILLYRRKRKNYQLDGDEAKIRTFEGP